MTVKYYAVRKGLVPGIYMSWDECRTQVDGYSGASYKSFKTKEEAQAFLDGTAQITDAGNADNNENECGAGVLAYVDGSYNAATGEFSYGVVIIRDGEEHTFSQKANEPELAVMHNVAGEIKGAEAAMKYAVSNGLDGITIYHDYEGIAKWCTGEWKASKPGTIAYRNYYNEIKEKVRITFVKVRGHSGNKYNDMADELAKKALGL